MITLDELIFDPANPDTSANVGAHILAGDDGTAIGHVGDRLKVDADFGSVVDLDIRDLQFATDSVDVSGSVVALDAASLAALENITVTVSNEVEITNDVGNPLPINATDLDIRDLTFATDSVDVSGSEVKQDSYDTIKHTAQTVNTTASALAGTPLTDRVRMTIQNIGTRAIFIGGDNTVTSSTGTRINRGASADFMFSANSTPHAITNSGTANVRILEMAY